MLCQPADANYSLDHRSKSGLDLSLQRAHLENGGLLPFARALQARCGYSDQFVTDLALALPLSAFIMGTVAGLIWLVR
jgi:hypothetical protein